MYNPTKLLQVYLWGHRVGVMALDDTGEIIFEYDYDFRKSGLEIAPIKMPVSGGKYYCSQFGIPRKAFYGLPGAFADSLPDSFGNRLVAEWMQREGIELSEISALDRLAYVGHRGMGALVYEPVIGSFPDERTVLDMRRLVESARYALNANLRTMDGDNALREIIRVGASAGGAQAKAVVGWNRSTGEFIAGDGDLPDDFEHWLMKFTPKGLEDAGEKEFAFYEKALACGIVMSECHLYELDGMKHFMTKRFDREGNRRFHVQTLCALQHLPHLAPRELMSYDILLRTAVELGLDYDALEQLFRRMAFNILTNEMDDHTKNFSFLMRENGKWELAPAYDLTSYHDSVADPDFFDFTNRHALSVNGKFSAIKDEDLLVVADRFGIGTAKKVLKQMKEVLEG